MFYVDHILEGASYNDDDPGVFMLITLLKVPSWGSGNIALIAGMVLAVLGGVAFVVRRFLWHKLCC